jgi:protein-S-isoprenylcysteine O-methyltransferase Ste14
MRCFILTETTFSFQSPLAAPCKHIKLEANMLNAKNQGSMTENSNSPQITPLQLDWIARWQRIARRIRVPLGFVVGALYIFELFRRAPQPTAVVWSLALVLPGLWLRGYAAGYVKKNRELTVTGPYAHTRNPLYLGSILIAAGFALALLSWPVALVLAVGFAVIYVPVIASEERFLRATFAGFDDYCQSVPRLIPRLTPAPALGRKTVSGAFSFSLYLQHREYNAGVGAALLYLSLLLLRPLVAAWVHLPQ